MATAVASIYNSNSSEVSRTNTAILSGETAASWSWWIYRLEDKNLDEHYVLKWPAGTSAIFVFWKDFPGNLFIMDVAGLNAATVLEMSSTSAMSVLAPPLGWYHFCVTWSVANNFKLYVNGVNKSVVLRSGSSPASINTTQASSLYKVMRAHTNDRFMNGNMNDVQVFNVELSVDKIQEIMSNPFSAPIYNCVSWMNLRQSSSPFDLITNTAITYNACVPSTDGGKVSSLYSFSN